MTILWSAAIRSTAIAAAGLFAARLLRQRSAALRHWVLAAAIAGAGAVPLLMRVAPAVQLPMPLFASSSSFSSNVQTAVPDFGSESESLISAQVPMGSIQRSASKTAPAAITRETAKTIAAKTSTAAVSRHPLDIGQWIFRGWLFSVAAGLLLLLAGMLRLRRLVRHSAILTSGRWYEIAPQVAAQYGLKRPVQLLESRDPSVLATWGVLHPKMFVPAGAIAWPDAQIRAAICHEFAHIRRADWLTQFYAEIVRTIFWFNPVFWIALKRLVQQSEHACDDAALRCGMAGADYADQLVAVAQALRRPQQAWSLPLSRALSMARPSTLEQRFAAILNPQANRSAVTRLSAIVTLTLFSLMTAAAAATHVSRPVLPPLQPIVQLATPLQTPLGPPLTPQERPPQTAMALPVSEAATLAQAASNESGSVEGRVTLAGTANPLSDVQVALVAAGSRGGSPSLTVLTSMDGRFALANVAAGSYTLRVQRPGYFAAVAGGSSYLISTPVTLAPGQHIRDLAFALLEGGVIRGNVIDEDGRAIPNATVDVMSQTFLPDGNPRVSALNLAATQSLTPNIPTAQSTNKTDDTGAYRLYWMPPGTYYVRAQYNPSGPSGPSGPAGPGLSALSGLAGLLPAQGPPGIVAYYPAVNEVSNAAPVVVTAGGETTANITVRRPVRYTISGKLIEAKPSDGSDVPLTPQGQRAPVPSYSLYLLPRDREALADRTPAVLASLRPVKGSATFSIPFVAPGSYYLVARNGRSGYGQVPIDVGRDNVENVVIEIPDKTDLKGHVTVAGDPASASLRGLHVALRPEFFEGVSVSGDGDVKPEDGSFSYSNLAPGNYLMDFVSLPENLAVISARQGARDVIKDGVLVAGDAPVLEIVVSGAGGRVDGVVHTAAGKPSAAVVAIVPQAKVQMTMSNRRIAADADGHFTLGNLPPGTYRIYAWEDAPVAAELNRAYMQNRESLGTLVSITAGSRLNVDLKLIPK